MGVTQEADYALRMVCLLAERGEVVGAEVLAGTVAVPTRFGQKILRKLSDAGLVRALRGASGGFRLVADPEELTLRQVIEVIDGPIALRHCLDDSHSCSHHPCKDECRLHHLFATLNAVVIERLDKVTVGMVVDETISLGQLLDTVR